MDFAKIKPILIIFLFVSTILTLFLMVATASEVELIKDYSTIHNLLETDALALHDNLSAGNHALSYVPESGWVFVITNYGQYNFKEVSSAITQSLEALELLVIQGRVDTETKITVSLILDFAKDHFIVFKAEDLKKTDRWKIYRGGDD